MLPAPGPATVMYSSVSAASPGQGKTPPLVSCVAIEANEVLNDVLLYVTAPAAEPASFLTKLDDMNLLMRPVRLQPSLLYLCSTILKVAV